MSVGTEPESHPHRSTVLSIDKLVEKFHKIRNRNICCLLTFTAVNDNKAVVTQTVNIVHSAVTGYTLYHFIIVERILCKNAVSSLFDKIRIAEMSGIAGMTSVKYKTGNIV